MIQILEASFFILEIAPRDHYHGLVSEFMIKSFHEIGLCIRIGIGRFFFGVQSVACTFAREFDRKAPPSGGLFHTFPTYFIFNTAESKTSMRVSI